MNAQPFVILDRDGTIIAERHYLSHPDEVELLPGAAAGLRRLEALGCGLLVVTNQSGIGRGLFDAGALDRVHRRMTELLHAAHVWLDGIYYCPHHPDAGCRCRKPRPGLVQEAAAERRFDPRQAVVIGDNVCDIDLGRAVGATTLLVRTGYGAQVEARGLADPDFIVDDLDGAAAVIERLPAFRNAASGVFGPCQERAHP